MTIFGGPRAAGRNQARHIASWLHETKMRRNKKDEKPFNFSSTVIQCIGRTDLILLGGILKHVQRHLAVRLSKVETQATKHTPHVRLPVFSRQFVYACLSGGIDLKAWKKCGCLHFI